MSNSKAVGDNQLSQVVYQYLILKKRYLYKQKVRVGMNW